MTFGLRDILEATGGRAVADGAGAFSGISTDSRSVRPGELFIPLVGKSFDGHDFIASAFEKGASGALAARGRAHGAPPGRTLIEVDDTLRALQDIAHFVRMSRGDARVVGVTGTNGKTTTKEMLAAVLSVRGPVLRNEGNLNNEIGVPLTLLRLEPGHWAAVVEMGMSGFGEIRRLAEIALPEVGVITNVGPAHLESLGGMEGVARAKGELVESLPEYGRAVLNADDPYLKDMIAARAGSVVTFGLGRGAAVTASGVSEPPGGVGFRLITPAGAADVSLPVMGAHNVYNALAAAAAAYALGFDAQEIAAGLAGFRPVRMRMELVDIEGVRVINDAYNANPASMAAALTALASVKGGRRVAVLGDMLELGESAARAHFDVGRLAGAQGFDLLLLMGGHAEDTARGAAEAGMGEAGIIIVAGPEEAAAVLAQRLRPTDHVLVKGSRSMRMERVVELLKSRRMVA